jgi:hypothetical protein
LSRYTNYIIAVTADENHGGAFQFFFLNDILFSTLLTKYDHLTDTCSRGSPEITPIAGSQNPTTLIQKPGDFTANAYP